MSYDELLEQTMSKFKEDGWDAGISYIDNYIDKFPNCLEAYLIRSEFYTEIDDDFQKALDDAEKAIKINPYNAATYNNRGYIYAKFGGDINKALNDFNKAIELDESNFKAYTNRANMYLKLGEIQRVVSDCTKAIELMSGVGKESCEPYYNRGLAYANMGEVNKALNDFNKTIELAPENAEAYAKCGLIYWKLGKIQEAIRNSEKFLELDPNNTKAELVRNVLKLSNSWLGRGFIRIYYTIWFGNKKWFSRLWKSIIDKIVCKLQNRGVD
jgi:tetratricopeptide (TPR) repeat protein